MHYVNHSVLICLEYAIVEIKTISLALLQLYYILTYWVYCQVIYLSLLSITLYFLFQDWYRTKRQSISSGRYRARSTTLIDDWQLWTTWDLGETKTTAAFAILHPNFFDHILLIFSNLCLCYNVVLVEDATVVSYINFGISIMSFIKRLYVMVIYEIQ